MYDINLFERFKPKPKKTNYFRLLVFFLLISFVAFVVYYEFNFYIKKGEIELEIEELQSYNTSPQTIKKLGEIREKTSKLDELLNIHEKLFIVDQFMTVNNVVQAGLLTSISSSVPEHCFLTTVGIASTSLTLSGYADGYESVADFQHKLRKTGKLAMIFNPSITEENANYSFSFAAQIWRGLNNESK